MVSFHLFLSLGWFPSIVTGISSLERRNLCSLVRGRLVGGTQPCDGGSGRSLQCLNGTDTSLCRWQRFDTPESFAVGLQSGIGPASLLHNLGAPCETRLLSRQSAHARFQTSERAVVVAAGYFQIDREILQQERTVKPPGPLFQAVQGLLNAIGPTGSQRLRAGQIVAYLRGRIFRNRLIEVGGGFSRAPEA